MHIVIIHKASENSRTIRNYTIATLADIWEEKGYRVTHLFGPKRYVAADLALLHVDLSVVPKNYIALAKRYPFTLNRGITDIRKCQISQNLVRSRDGYKGRVIVKCNFNYGGLPEREGSEKKRRFLFWKRKPLKSRLPQPLLYPIYNCFADIPQFYKKDPLLVVEKFLPEYADGFYFVRQSYFLGAHHRSWRLRSAHPIIRAEEEIDDVEIPTPEEIKIYRNKIKLDYGKIDFLEHEGRLIILDVNKTIGTPAPPLSSPYLASAIESMPTPSSL